MANSVPLWMLLLLGFLAIGSQVLFVRVSRRIRSRIAKEQPFAGLVKGLLTWALVLTSIGLWVLTVIAALELVPETEPLSHRLLSLGGSLFRAAEDVIFTPFIKRGISEISIYTVLKVIVFGRATSTP